MHYDPRCNNHGLPHDPFKALVVPRPIGWISTRALDGTANLAPYSYFNAVCDRPKMVMFASVGWKDSVRNAAISRSFACNLATWELRDAMNISSQGVEPGVDEFALAGLESLPGQVHATPTVAAAPVVMECETRHILQMPDATPVALGPGVEDVQPEPAATYAVFGEVVGIRIDDDLIVDGRVDTTRVQPIARLGYMDYDRIEAPFRLKRPS